MNVLFIILTVVILLAAILLIIVVLLQNGKGAGMASNFVAGNQTLGVRQTADILEKTTWTLAIVIIVLCVLATAFVSTRKATSSTLKDQIENAATVPAQPQFPIDPIAPSQEVPAQEAPAAPAQ